MEDLVLKATKQTKDNKPYVNFPKEEYWQWLEQVEDGNELIVTISDRRSLGKNAALHGWIHILADETGEDFDTMKYWVVITNFGYTIKEIDGQEYKVPISTSKLNNKKFGQGLTKTYIWALEKFNVTLPSNDYML